MNINNAIIAYENNGYSYADAESKVSQDIVLSLIGGSKYSKHITIKGGVVMHNISNDIRRATRDLDIDFIKYSLDDESIKQFIKELNYDSDIKIGIVGDISKLHHQDYDGKRVYIEISDKFDNIINTKLDIGVHKLFEIVQDEYCFDLNLMNKKVNLLINSKEQIFTEKLKLLLKLGFRSTRYKDIFDFYYLINEVGLDNQKLIETIRTLILTDNNMKENSISDIVKRLETTLKSPRYMNNLNNPSVNWLDIKAIDAINSVLEYLEKLSDEIITV